MSTTTMTPHDELTILKLLHNGRGPDFAAAVTKVPQAEVQRIADANGWPDADRLGYAVDEHERRLRDQAAVELPQATTVRRSPVQPATVTRTPQPAPRPAAVQHPTLVQSPAASAPAPAPADTIAGLLARAEKLTGPGTHRVQAAAKRARDAVSALQEALTDVEERRRQQAAKDAENARLRDQASRLERELAAVRARLRTSTESRKPAAKTSKFGGGDRTPQVEAAKRRHAHIREVLDRHGATVADVRAWAAQNGHYVTGQGMLRVAVVDAFDAAQTATG